VSHPLAKVLAALSDRGLRETGGGRWEARCPAHDDSRPSLSIGQGEAGRVLLKCHRGCATEAVVSALGLQMNDLFATPLATSSVTERRRVVAEYGYFDETGTLLFQVQRLHPKGFRQRRPASGGWSWSLRGVRRVLYRLPDLCAGAVDVPVFIVEGEKDVDALVRLGLLATTNPGGAGKWRAEYGEPLRARHVVLLPDNDRPGQEHAHQVEDALASVAASVRIVNLPGLPPKGDVSDWIAAGGTAAALTELVGQFAPRQGPQFARGHVGKEEPKEIVVGPDESRVVDEAIAALSRAPELFVRGDALVEVIVDDPETRGLVSRGGPLARIVSCAEPRVRELLAREGKWRGSDGSSNTRAVHPPRWAVRSVMARRSWPLLRPITAVATAPTMRPDGTILVDEGYDPLSGLYLASTAAVRLAQHPTHDDARRAIDQLLDVVHDFPASPAAKSAWIAGVVSVAVRPAILGPTPMMIVDASVRGSGKSLMVDVAAMITTGRAAARLVYSRDDAEMRKVITAVALVGDPLVLLDNTVGEIGCASLDAALTADTWRDRILGSSNMTTELPLRVCWWTSGNGLSVGADLIRRALLVRLEPACERPDERSAFRHPRLLDHVRENRAALLGAALTIARAYVVAGKPTMSLVPMGSFETWSDLVRSALCWAGAPDPCATVAELRAVDLQADAIRAAIDAWPARVGQPMTAADLIEQATTDSTWRDALIGWCVPRGSADLPTAKALGYALRAIRGRVVGGRMLTPAPRTKHGIAWILLRLGAAGAGDDGVERDDAIPTADTTP
jgi:putative DNA primase/helicase